MQLWEISLAFNKCTGEENNSFKQYLQNLYISEEELISGKIIKGSFNYILADVEKLITKIISNIISSYLLNKEGMLSWGYVTSYYANYFSFQALNRLHLNFLSYTDSLYLCTFTNYLNNELLIKKSDSSKTHLREYQLYAEKRNKMSMEKSPDRLWSIANSKFKFGDEVSLRNEINYSITPNNFSEFLMTKEQFLNIKQKHLNSPLAERSIRTPEADYSNESLKYSLSRLRVIIFILNRIANDSNLYQSYYVRRNRERIRSITTNFGSDLPDWMSEYFSSTLTFSEKAKETELH